MLTRLSDNIYDLTPMGKRWFRQHKPGSRLAGFCAYHLEVGEINTFSEPEEQHGHIIRNVTFTYRKKYEDWAKQALNPRRGRPQSQRSINPFRSLLNADDFNLFVYFAGYYNKRLLSDCC